MFDALRTSKTRNRQASASRTGTDDTTLIPDQHVEAKPADRLPSSEPTDTADGPLPRPAPDPRPAGQAARVWKYVGVYTLVWVVVFAVALSPFWLEGRSFVWHKDGLWQHYPALIYYREWLLSIGHALSQGHLSVPTYAFTSGLGDNVLPIFYSVGYLDLPNLLVVLVPPSGVEAFYTVGVLVRLYAAGLAFLWFARYFRCRSWAAVAGSFAFVLCTYATVATPRHPFFAIPLVYVPLLFLGLEKVLRGERSRLLVISVALFALTGFYFLYMAGIVMILYTAVRLVARHGREWRPALRSLARVAGWSLLGLLLAGVVLVPLTKCYLDSARTGVGHIQADLLPTWQTLARQVTYAVVPRPSWDQLGLVAATVPAVCAVLSPLASTRIRLQALGLGVPLAALYLVPAGGLVMNGFGYVSGRWTFLASFFAAFAVAWALPRLVRPPSMRLARRVALASVACLVVYAQVVTLTDKWTVALYGVLALGLSLVVLCLPGAMAPRLSGPTAGRRLGVGLAACATVLVVVNAAGNAVMIYGNVGSGYAEEFLETGTAAQRYQDVVDQQASAPAGSEARTAMDTSLPNMSLVSGRMSTSSYWSLSNSDYVGALRDLELVGMPMAFRIRDLDDRIALEALAGVEYKVVGPGGNTSWDGYGRLSSSEEHGTVYAARDPLPFGYLYTASVPGAEFGPLDALDKQEAMTQAAAVDLPGAASPATTTHVRDLSLTSRRLPATRHLEGVRWTKGRLKVTKAQGTITLSFHSPAHSETYVRIVSFERAEGEKPGVAVSSEGRTTGVPTRALDSMYYFSRPGVLVNLGYSEKERTTATVTFTGRGKASLKSLQVWSVPIDSEQASLKALADGGMQDAALGTDSVTGSVDATRPGYLVLPLPYDPGWTATVDGHAQPVVRANAMFLGVHLPAGSHDVRLAYRLPWLDLGLAATGAGLVAVLLVPIVPRLRGRWRAGGGTGAQRKADGER